MKKNKIIFDEEKHEYTINGIKVPSVTEVLGMASNIVYKDVNEHVLKLAGEKGSEVHFAIELYNDTGYEEISEKNKGYLDAYKTFLEDYKDKFVILESEAKLFHKTLQYAGTADIIAEYNGEKIIVDIKTTTKPLYFMVGMQVPAYKEAYNSNHKNKVNKSFMLHLVKDGKYEFVEVKENFEMFIKLLEAYKYIKENL